jgi:uncharacterized integral membrane protein
MYECSELSYIDYWNVIIASNVMSSLADWALLIVIVYILNSMLFKQLESSSSWTKTVLRIIVGVMFAVIVADMVLFNYIFSRSDYPDYDLVFLSHALDGLSLTLDVLWLISIVVSAAISLSKISAMRPRRLPGGVSLMKTHSVGIFANKSAGSCRLGVCPLRHPNRSFYTGNCLHIQGLLA